MINPYTEYYINQAGSGLTFFEGRPYQRGHGFFGDLWSHILKPLGKYIGKKAISTGTKIGTDLMSGQDPMVAIKSNLKEAGQDMFEDGVKRTRKFVQTGKGRRRRKRAIKKRRKSKRKPKRRRPKKRKHTKRKKINRKKNRYYDFLN